MLRSLTFNFAGPICACNRQNLSWGFEPAKDPDNNLSLCVWCEDCATEITIPKIRAYFDFDRPYPSDVKEKKDSQEDGQNTKPLNKKSRKDKKNRKTLKI
jgi:hypothetical protein